MWVTSGDTTTPVFEFDLADIGSIEQPNPIAEQDRDEVALEVA